MQGDADLRAEVETAVLAEIERAGPAAFSKSSIVKRFLDRGTSRSTLFKWVGEILASGKPGQHLARIVKEAAAERAQQTPAPMKEIVGEIEARLPVALRLEEASLIGGSLRVLEDLAEAVTNFKLLIRHAKTEHGGVRNARLLLSASDKLRSAVETAVRLHQAMRQVDQIDRLHRAIIRRIGELSPETAEAILRDIDRLAAEWGG